MSWVDLPFPQCPNCANSWSESLHRDCVRFGRLKLDPDRRHVKCGGCSIEWTIGESRFFCTCGRQFLASEVESAVSEIVRAAKLLADIMETYQADIAEIRSAGSNSFRSWLSKLTGSIAESLGSAIGTFFGSVVRSLFGST